MSKAKTTKKQTVKGDVKKTANKKAPAKKAVKKVAPKKATLKGVKLMKNSLAVQKALAPKVTEKMVEATFELFTDLMTGEAIATKIGKTKNAVRLEAMRQVAKMLGLKSLMRLARAQRNTVYAS